VRWCVQEGVHHKLQACVCGGACKSVCKVCMDDGTQAACAAFPRVRESNYMNCVFVLWVRRGVMVDVHGVA